MQSKDTINRETSSSGISKLEVLPKILPYPTIHNIDDLENNIKNIFCYVIKHYGKKGLSVLIYRQIKDDQVVVLCGDWFGNPIDLEGSTQESTIASEFVKNELLKYLNVMHLIKIDQVQLFFAQVEDELVLVDLQVAVNKLAGPGMVRDIFGKVVKTQEVVKTEVLDERAVQAIREGCGSYAGDLIIKPTRFRMYHDPEKNIYTPMYVEVIR